MLKLLKMKLLMTFVAIIIVGGISIKTLPLFYNADTSTKKVQTSNVKDVAIENQNDDKEGSSVNSSNNNDVNKSQNSSTKLKQSNNNGNTSKIETVSKSERSSDSNNINNQESINSKLEQPNNNATNKEADISTSLNSEDIDVSVENNNDNEFILEKEIPIIRYDRTTSIYANDNITLLRVEYYIDNKLTYYSVIEQFDAATKSYIEKIYQCNRETNIDSLIRTDEYISGSLIKSY